MGLLDGHQGGVPAKLTADLLDTAEAIARTAPATLAKIARQVHEVHPEAPDFSLDRLSAGLRARGLAFTRTRLSLKKVGVRSSSRPAARVNLKHGQEAACAGKISLFYLDESGFCTIPNVQRAWNPKGKPHTANASLARQRVNVVGALDYATGEVWHEVHTQSIRRNAVVALIDRIAQREADAADDRRAGQCHDSPRD
jgi:hypothetical protein